MAATILEDAKCFLSSLSKHPHDPQVLLSSDPQQAHLILAHVLDLARSMFLAFINQGPPVTLESPDWTVVKAVYEILVKWGIYPGLAAGVGTPPLKRFKSKGYVDAATAAVFEHVKYSNLGDAEALECGSGSAVFECAEFLVRVACSESSSTSLTRNHVLVQHLPDVWAAYFQLGYGDMRNWGSEQNPQELRAKAIQRIEYLAMNLPVGHAIEALLALLGQDAPLPPQWLKREVGKILSRLVMREGGVVAVLERLVGGAAQGDVSTYRRIAAHLAKCPKQVAEPEMYYSQVCTQVLPYLRPPTYLKQKQQQSQISSGITNNIHHTSVLLACSMAQQELELLNKYFIAPLLDPFFKWMSMMDETKDQKPGDTVTEDAIINCALVLQVLISAGHPGSKLISQVIFERMNMVMPKILALHFLLGAPKDQHEIPSMNKREVVVRPESDINGESSGNTFLKRFRISIADLVATALKTQSPEYLIDIAYDYLLLEQDYIKWPNADSEISAAISGGHVHHKSPARHLSEFFSSVETWELAMKLMNKVFKRIVQLHKLVKQKPMAAFHTSTEFLKLTSYLEELIEGVGSKALEEDAAVLPFVKDLIDDDDIMFDEDILELALHMIFQLLQKLIERSKSLSEAKPIGGQEAYWASILSSLQRIYTSDLSSSKAKGMASTLYKSLVEECVCSSR